MVNVEPVILEADRRVGVCGFLLLAVDAKWDWWRRNASGSDNSYRDYPSLLLMDLRDLGAAGYERHHRHQRAGLNRYLVGLSPRIAPGDAEDVPIGFETEFALEFLDAVPDLAGDILLKD